MLEQASCKITKKRSVGTFWKHLLFQLMMVSIKLNHSVNVQYFVETLRFSSAKLTKIIIKTLDNYV